MRSVVVLEQLVDEVVVVFGGAALAVLGLHVRDVFLLRVLEERVRVRGDMGNDLPGEAADLVARVDVGLGLLKHGELGRGKLPQEGAVARIGLVVGGRDPLLVEAILNVGVVVEVGAGLQEATDRDLKFLRRDHVHAAWLAPALGDGDEHQIVEVERTGDRERARGRGGGEPLAGGDREDR